MRIRIYSLEQVSSIKLMDTEVALYWKVMCRHLQAEAQETFELSKVKVMLLILACSLVKNNCHKIKLMPYSMSCTVPWSVSEKVGLDGGINLDANPVVPSTPAPRSVRPAPARRRARRAPSSSDDSEAEAEGESLDLTSVSRVPATPSMTAVRAQRASKTAALGKFTAAAPSDSEQDE
ncbi:hypothetical protein ACQ4PT_044704 [Festuca glaucescens]